MKSLGIHDVEQVSSDTIARVHATGPGYEMLGSLMVFLPLAVSTLVSTWTETLSSDWPCMKMVITISPKSSSIRTLVWSNCTVTAVCHS